MPRTSLWIVLALAVVAGSARPGQAAGPSEPPPVTIRAAGEYAPNPIEKAAMAGDFRELERLYPQVKPGLRFQALWSAVEKNRTDVVEWLIAQGIGANPPELGLANALHLAAAQDNGPMIRLLCRHGADPNWRDRSGGVALHRAMQDDEANPRGASAIAAVLDCGATLPPPRSDMLGDGTRITIPALHDVARFDDPVLVQRVLDLGAPIKERRHRGRTVLFQRGLDADVLRLLLARGADARMVDESGASALAYDACHPGWETNDVIAQLVKAGAPLDTADPSPGYGDGATALMCASAHGLVDGVRLLLEAGADPNRMDKNGRTALGVVADPPMHLPRHYLTAFHPKGANLGAQARIVGLLSAHGARTELDATVREHARNSGPVGAALLAAMQPDLLRELEQCMKQRSPVLPAGVRASPTAAAPAGDRFTRAVTTPLPGAGDIAQWFSLSPDGRWLVYIAGTNEQMDRGREAVAYDFASGRRAAVTLAMEASGETARWRRDGRAAYFIATVGDYAVVELGDRPAPAMASRDFDDAPDFAPTRAGGDPCGNRGETGLQVDPRAWMADGEYRLRHPLTGAKFKLDSSRPGQDTLALEGPQGSRTLAVHDRAWVERKWRAHYEKMRLEFAAHMPQQGKEKEAARRELDDMVDKMIEGSRRSARPELDSVQLSPSGRYLYYHLRFRGGEWGGPPGAVRRFVVDLEAPKPAIWEVEAHATSAQWHPNGRDLLLRVLPADDKAGAPAQLAIVRLP